MLVSELLTKGLALSNLSLDMSGAALMRPQPNPVYLVEAVSSYSALAGSATRVAAQGLPAGSRGENLAQFAVADRHE